MVFVVISPFAFLTLLICVFSLHFSQVCQASVDLVYFVKEPTFCFIHSLYGFFVSMSLISTVIFIIFLLFVLRLLVFLGV
jgi:hypothetical protein